MSKHLINTTLSGLVLLFGLPLVSPAGAQQATQVLDRVEAFNETAVLRLNFDEPDRMADFSVFVTDPQAKVHACKLTATKGLWCLDNKRVVNWPDPADATSRTEVLSCEDPALDLDVRKETCTGLTVDNAGAIYLAGTNKGNSHSLIKIVEKQSGICPGGFSTLAHAPDYCFDVQANGRPLLVDINPIDGDSADQFNPSCASCAGSGKGTIGLEERKTAIFFPDDGQPVEIASGKRDWNLEGNEQLSSVGFLQLPTGPDRFESLILVTTTDGRVLAAETDGTPDTREVFDIPAARSGTSTLCAAGDPFYGIRVSAKSGVVYVTDRNFCEVSALQPATDASGALVGLVNIQEDGSNLTLSTSSAQGIFPPNSPTLAPGKSINLADCDESCVLVNDANGNAAASLSNVTVVSDETGLTLFQIQGIPDCRYIPDVCVALLDDVNTVADLKGQGIILDRPGGNTAPAQLLNVTPLLPKEVTDLLGTDAPALWIPRWYRGQQSNGFVFDAFFGLTDASFSGVFELEVLVANLTGRGELGCRVGDPNNTPVSTLRQYDVTVKVSETFRSLDRNFIPGSGDHEATLVNIGCGSSRNGFERWSLVPVNMEFVPDTFDSFTFQITNDDQALFLKLLISLFDDLRGSVNELACQTVDGQASAPLSSGDCASLDSQWLNTKDKLDKCIDATIQPKTSLRDQNCQAFESQLDNFIADWQALTVSGQDPANRIGEIGLRLQVIDNVYSNLFFPSIPDGGFAN